MHKNLLFFFLLCLCFPLAAQRWTWASDVGRYFITQSQLRVKTNDAGDMFTSGTFWGRVQLGDTTFFKDTSYYGNHANYVARFTSENKLIWAQLIDGSQTLVYDLAVDDWNHTFVVGYYDADLVLADTVLHDGPKNFIISYTGSGKRRWMKTFAKSWMRSDRIMADKERNLVYSYNMIDSSVVEKRDGGTGVLLWRKSFPSFLTNSMCVDSKNNILLAIPWGTDTFRLAGRTFPPSGYQKDAYLVTLSASGDVSTIECLKGVLSPKVVFDGDDNICLAGYYHNTMHIRNCEVAAGNFDDAFVGKLDTRGGVAWIRANGAPGVWITSIDALPSGEVYCAGSFNDSLRFYGFDLHEKNARTALHIMKFDKDGHSVWAMKNGGGDGSDATAYSLAVNNDGNIVVAGSYHTYLSTEWFGADTLANTSFHDNIFLARADGSVLSNVKYTPLVDLEMNIYPNPSNGSFRVALSDGWEQAQLVIYDLLGNEFCRSDVKAGTFEVKSSLPSGVYIAEVKNDSKKSVRRLVVE